MHSHQIVHILHRLVQRPRTKRLPHLGITASALQSQTHSTFQRLNRSGLGVAVQDERHTRATGAFFVLSATGRYRLVIRNHHGMISVFLDNLTLNTTVFQQSYRDEQIASSSVRGTPDDEIEPFRRRSEPDESWHETPGRYNTKQRPVHLFPPQQANWSLVAPVCMEMAKRRQP